MKKHEIKVQEQHTPASMFNTRAERRAPKLTMTGKWLAAAGFTAGVTAVIEVRAGELVIRPAVEVRKVEEPRPQLKATRRAPWADVRDELTQAFH